MLCESKVILDGYIVCGLARITPWGLLLCILIGAHFSGSGNSMDNLIVAIIACLYIYCRLFCLSEIWAFFYKNTWKIEAGGWFMRDGLME